MEIIKLNQKCEMIFPCCKKELPAPLEGVALATCACGQSFLPSVITEYNEMLDVLIGWRDVVNGKAYIKVEPGEEKFVGDLVRKGLELIISIDIQQRRSKGEIIREV